MSTSLDDNDSRKFRLALIILEKKSARLSTYEGSCRQGHTSQLIIIIRYEYDMYSLVEIDHESILKVVDR